MQSIYQALSELDKNHDPAALCTVVKSEGSTPRHVGSKMLVYPDGKFIGSIGGGDLEHRVLDEACMPPPLLDHSVLWTRDNPCAVSPKTTISPLSRCWL